MFKVIPETDRDVRRCGFVILATVLLCLPMSFLYSSMVHYVVGISMLPTVIPDRVLVVLWPWGDPDRGDIVLLHHAGEKRWVKRVVGLPGDHIVIEPGSGPIIVNGSLFEEPYLDQDRVYYDHRTEIILGTEEYFVLGDNRADSYDSRIIGPVLEDEILVSLDFWFQL